MTGGSFDPDESFDTAAADRATRRGLQIVFWAGCGAIVLALAWPVVRGLIAPAIVLAIAGLALWRFREAALVRALRSWITSRIAPAWAALLAFARLTCAIFLRRPYAHAFERAAHEQQARGTASELARIGEAEAAQIPTAEAGVFLSQARAAMEERLKQLLLVPKPTLAEHREREQLATWLREDRARAGEFVDRRSAVPASAGMTGSRQSGLSFFATADWRLPIGGLRSAHLWILGALVALSGGLYARSEKLKVDARREHAARAAAAQDRNYWRARAGRWERAYGDASAALRANAERVAQEAALSAQHLAAADRRNRQLAQDLRRIRNETSSHAAGADPGVSLRVLSEPVDPGNGRADAGAGDPAAGADPGP